MKRVKIIPKNPNKLFESWLEEWRDEAAAYNPQLQEHFSKALEALRKYPLPLKSGKECILLQHFGNKLCSMIDKRLEKHEAQQTKEVDTNRENITDKISHEDQESVKVHLDFNSDNESAEEQVFTQKPRKKIYNKKKEVCKTPEVDLKYENKNERTRDELEDERQNEEHVIIIDDEEPTAEQENYVIEQKSKRCQENSRATEDDFKIQQKRDTASDKFQCLEEIELTEEELRSLDRIVIVENDDRKKSQENKYSENCSESQEDNKMSEDEQKNLEDNKNSEDDIEVPQKNGSTSRPESIEISDDEDFPYFDLKNRIYHNVIDRYEDVLMTEPGPSRDAVVESLDDDNEVFNGIEVNRDAEVSLNNCDDDDDDNEVLIGPGSSSNTRAISNVTTKTTTKVSKTSSKGVTKKVIAKKTTQRTAKAILNENDNVNNDDDILMVEDEPLTRIPSTSSAINDKESAETVNEEPLIRTSDFSILPSNYDIILLVDTNEVKRNDVDDPVINRLTREDTPFEIRHLNVGDFLWITRCRETKRELVLPYIVERKRVDDLAASIKDGRYHEQKFRLRRSGIHNVIYMVERLPNGSMRTSLPLSTLLQAGINSVVHDGFTVKYTRDQRDSVLYLASFTKILTKLLSDKLLMACDKECLPDKFNVKDEQIYLMEFEEFYKATAKVRTWTVKEMFIKQLLQIKGLSLDGVLAIIERYPTPYLLKEALDAAGEEGSKLLATIPYGNTKRKLGPVLARTIWQLYTFEELK